MRRAAPEGKKETAELRLADIALSLMTRPWFKETLGLDLDRTLRVLLLNIYIQALANEPLHKKEAWKAVGIEDIKTGRKYITRAEQLGLIDIQRSPDDKRKELLFPSKRLLFAVAKEIEQLHHQLSFFLTTFESLRSFQTHDRSNYVLGDEVIHPEFGFGKITDILMGAHANRLTVDFAEVGQKKVLEDSVVPCLQKQFLERKTKIED